MKIIFPTPAQAAAQTPFYTFSPTSTPLANTYNGATYFYLPTLGVWSITPGSLTSGTVTQVDTGAGLTGGPITTTGTISIAPATNTSLGGVSPDGVVITIDPTGEITLSGTFRTSLIPDLNITYDLGSPTNRWRDLYLSNNTLYLGEYALRVVNGILEIDGVPAGSGVTEVIAGTGLSGGTITSTGTIALEDTGVTAGSYTNANITVDAQGRITTASSGSGGGGGVTSVTAGFGSAIIVDNSNPTEPVIGVESASSTALGVVQFATNAETQAGCCTNLAITPSGLQSKVSNATDSNSSTTIASSAAVKFVADIASSAVFRTVYSQTGALAVGCGSTGQYGCLQTFFTDGCVLTSCSTCRFGMYWASPSASSGTVTCVATGTGLSGGPITGNGTISLNAATPYDLGGVTGIANGSCLNTVLGFDAGGSYTSGTSNTVVGRSAGTATTSGSENVYVGAAAGSAALGSSNVAIGVFALGNTGSNASSNVAVGNNAMRIATGCCNIAIGPGSLEKVTGTRNIALGNGALVNGTTADNNIGVGWQAFLNLTTGRNNLEIGANNGITNVYSPPFNVTTECNRVVIGSTATTNAYIQVAWTYVSDERDKTEITALPLGLDFVSQLEPISYRFKESRESDVAIGQTKYGFSAQQVLAVEGDNPVVVDIEDPEKLKITDANLIPILVQAIKELKAEVDELKSRG